METFVVRVWRPVDPQPEEGRPVLRGVIEHVGSGRSDHFREEAHLIDLIRAALARARDDGVREEIGHDSRT